MTLSALREGVQRLEITTRVTLGVLALASGVYTYLGVRDLLNGNATIVFFAAVIYSVAVSIGIYAFWTFLMRFLPHVTEPRSRGLLFGCMALGSLMIIAMSAWLNASALAGAAAIQQHLAISVQAYTRDLDRAHSNALAAQSLLPDIQMAATRFSKLAEAERGGSLTGTSGSGTVVQLADPDVDPARQSLARKSPHRPSAPRRCTSRAASISPRCANSSPSRGPINARSDAFGTEAMALMGMIASLQQTSVAPAVKRAADGLASGFIAPAAGGRGDLAERQTSVVGKVEGAVAAQAAALSAAADKILQVPAGRAGALPAAVHRRSGVALCRRFHPELGGRDLDRPDARGAGADPLRGACRHPPRRRACRPAPPPCRRPISSRRCGWRARSRRANGGDAAAAGARPMRVAAAPDENVTALATARAARRTSRRCPLRSCASAWCNG